MEYNDYEIGSLMAKRDALIENIDELDYIEDLAIEDGIDTTAIVGASVEELGSDKFLNKLQRGRERWYGDFISNTDKSFNKNIAWLRSLERDQKKLSDALAKSKSLDSKALGKLISDKMDGRFSNAISLMNGIDVKQIKHARNRYADLKNEIKRGREFIRKMSQFADKEFGFNDLIDDKLEPSDVIEYIKDFYSDSPDTTGSITSIKIYGVKRRFKTDKRQIMLDALNDEQSRTVLLSWSGSSIKYLTTMKGAETRIWSKVPNSPQTHYDDFYKRYSNVVAKHISDTTAISNLIDEMKDTIVIMNKINDSLAKLYMPSKLTFNELKFIRRFHLNITKILAFRIDDVLTSYRISHSIASIIERAVR